MIEIIGDFSVHAEPAEAFLGFFSRIRVLCLTLFPDPISLFPAYFRRCPPHTPRAGIQLRQAVLSSQFDPSVRCFPGPRHCSAGAEEGRETDTRWDFWHNIHFGNFTCPATDGGVQF